GVGRAPAGHLRLRERGRPAQDQAAAAPDRPRRRPGRRRVGPGPGAGRPGQDRPPQGRPERRGRATGPGRGRGRPGPLHAGLGPPVSAQSAILTLVDPNATRVDVSVDEVDIARIAPGKVAQVTFDAVPGRQFAGKVIGIAPSATLTQGLATYTVSVGVDDPEF